MPTFHQTEAWQIGPTIDTDMELLAPTFRQEPHELQVLPSSVDLRAAKPRPLTHKQDYQLRAIPATVLTRSSNQNPAGAGADDQSSSIWGVSEGMGNEAAATQVAPFTPQSLVMPAALAILAGVLIARYG